MTAARRGFSLMEILIALGVAGLALAVMLTTLSTSNQHALGSRNRSVAILMAQSLMDDIETHKFGDPKPQWWDEAEEEPVDVWIAGRQQKMVFQKTVTCEGSFVGNGTANKDLVTITITWRENFGATQTGAGETNNKELEVRVPVWR